MNKELIQKLFSKSCWDEQAEIDIAQHISVEKFADLIVRECVKVVDLWCDEVPCSEGYDKFTVSKLKERFGIEE